MKSIYNKTIVAALLLCAACDPKEDGIEGVATPTGFAITHSDYTVGAIALLGEDGSLAKKRFVHSGTTFDGLNSALASDLGLPTRGEPGGVLTYLERYGSDTVTRIDIGEGEVLGQLKTHPADADGFSSNPQDYFYIDADTAWVSRHATNEDAEKKADRGNDLMKIDPGAPKRTSTTISFDEFNTTAEVTNPDTGETAEVTVYARPGQMAMAGDALVVGMARLSAAYDAIGSGMVGIVDLEAESVQSLQLKDLSNCGSVAPVVGDDSRVIVSCLGFFRGEPRDGAGLVVLHNHDGEVEIETTWRAADHDDEPLAVSNAVSLGGTRVVAIELGDSDKRSDQAYVVDIADGSMNMLASGVGSYVLGSGCFVAAENTLLLPDASTDDDGVVTGGLRRFKFEDGEDPEELSKLKTDDDLPPRVVRPLF